jgi:hypothetical protein
LAPFQAPVLSLLSLDPAPEQISDPDGEREASAISAIDLNRLQLARLEGDLFDGFVNNLPGHSATPHCLNSSMEWYYVTVADFRIIDATVR